MESSPAFTPPPADHRPHLIPSWMVPFLAMPFRTWVDDPARSVLPLIQSGMRILEIGPGSGFFTLPMAQVTGPTGALLCVELQEPVRRRLQEKLRRKRLPWVEVRSCSDRDLQVADLAGRMDLAVAIDVLHEMPEPALAILRMHQSLRPGGRMLLLEPRGHCPEALFSAEKTWAAETGFTQLPDPGGLGIRRWGALFHKPQS